MEGPETNEGLNALQNHFWDNKDKSFEFDSEMKLLVFGRKLYPYEKNVYETVLSTPGTSYLIELIWKCFQLKNYPEVFYTVSIFFNILK